MKKFEKTASNSTIYEMNGVSCPNAIHQIKYFICTLTQNLNY